MESPETLIEALRATVDAVASKEFLRYHDGSGYVSISYGEFADRTERLGTALVGLGLQTGDRVGILSENCPEWSIADFAIMSAGLVSVPLYATLPAQQIAYILKDAQTKAIVLSDREQAEKVVAIRDECADMAHVICVSPEAMDAIADARAFSELIEEAPREGADKDAFVARRDAVVGEDAVTLIYTSGTTGRPKGVVLTHANFMSNVRGGLEALQVRSDDVFLSFLPLSHAFERMACHFLPMTVGAAVAYSRGLRYVGRELGEVRPTLMASVPRFYESLQERVLKAVESGPPLKRRMFAWAMARGRKKSRRIRAERAVGPLLGLACGIANKLVFGKLRENVGGRIRFFISGGAPLALSTAEFFHSSGILILEGYGLSETSPVIAVNHERKYRFGTVGPPIPGVEVRIAEEDGEVLTRGPHVMQGYFNLPDETRDAIDSDGWFHTGDLGKLEDGFLSITGRKKNLFKLSNGKYIAPEPVENTLKASPYIQEAVVIGESRKVSGAVVVPAFSALEEFAGREGVSTEDRAQLIEEPAVRKLYRQEIDRLTPNLADFERIRVCLLMAREFTLEAGELTPTFKVKRGKVLGDLAERIEAAYSGVG